MSFHDVFRRGLQLRRLLVLNVYLIYTEIILVYGGIYIYFANSKNFEGNVVKHICLL